MAYEYGHDCPFEAYITNLGKYNEGELVGEWVKFPTTSEDLKKVFELVKEYLAEDGVFIFDLNTVHKYRDLMGECTISENREESSFIWENYFYEDERVNEYDLTLFIREEEGLYRRFEETHYQRAYELETVKHLLEQAGLEFVAAYDAFTREPVKEDSERIYVIARSNQET